jgi:hypothetical protein
MTPCATNTLPISDSILAASTSAPILWDTTINGRPESGMAIHPNRNGGLVSGAPYMSVRSTNTDTIARSSSRFAVSHPTIQQEAELRLSLGKSTRTVDNVGARKIFQL